MIKKFNRRDFLKTGGVAVAGTLLLPSMLNGCSASAASPLNYQLNDYLDHFGVTPQMLQEVLTEGLSKGGDYCDLYFQHSITNSLGLEDNMVNRASSNIMFGVGIRVLNGEQTGYSYTEDLNLTSMKSAARTAANIASSSARIQVAPFTEVEYNNCYKIDLPWEEVSVNQKIPLLQFINEKAFSFDPNIIKTNVWFSDQTKYILFANSEGNIACDYQPLGRLGASCIAEKNGKREENYHGYSGRIDMSIFTEEHLTHVARKAVEDTIIMFDAVSPRGGTMPVVLGAGGSGILLHEAIGHGMEADFNRRGESIFSDKIGKKVAESFVTIIDDGTLPNLQGSINIDDEGCPTQKTVMVENGILTSYLHDRISSKHYGVAPTGNGRRESFRHMPLPRMRSTYMLNGPHTRDEIIESVKYGILAETFTNGQVNIGAGDFTFFVKLGYLIEDGKIIRPIKDVNIIGNGPRVLSDIVMVADDMDIPFESGTCGKGGQGVPTSDGQPTVKVSAITVGGVNS
jgi:TldD protein